MHSIGKHRECNFEESFDAAKEALLLSEGNDDLHLMALTLMTENLIQLRRDIELKEVLKYFYSKYPEVGGKPLNEFLKEVSFPKECDDNSKASAKPYPHRLAIIEISYDYEVAKALTNYCMKTDSQNAKALEKHLNAWIKESEGTMKLVNDALEIDKSTSADAAFYERVKSMDKKITQDVNSATKNDCDGFISILSNPESSLSIRYASHIKTLKTFISENSQ